MTIFGHFGVHFGRYHGNSYEYIKIDGTNGKPMANNIGLDTFNNFLAPSLLKKHRYTLLHLCSNPYISSFSGYSLGNHGNHITKIHEWNMKVVIDPCEANMSVDIFENSSILNFL